MLHVRGTSWLSAALLLTLSGVAGGSEPASGASGATGGAGGEAAATTPDAQQALTWLREGNERFVRGEVKHVNADAERRAAVAAGQNPFVSVLSCADSRVPVERLFDRGIGDVFVVRVAGNVADTDEIGTLEYGVGHLHTPLVVVMGHTSCGAVKAVLSGAEVHGSIPGLVDNIIPAVEWIKKNRPELTGDALVNAAIEANVWQAMDDLITGSSELREHVRSGKTMVVGAVYDLSSGKVRWLGEHPYQDRLTEATERSEHGEDVRNVPVPGAGHGEQPAADESEPHDSGDHAEAGHGTDGHDAPPAAPAGKHAPAKKTANAPTGADSDHPHH
ncbi:MAG: carbonic anhydrase [Planctomycetota bacterium]|nr:carbonic anhydrase [Planctomycetota bacterium]